MKAKLSLRSKVLVLLGKTIYGSPNDFGVDASAEEFYCLPNERHKVSPTINKLHASEHQYMKRNVFIEELRRRIYRDLSIFASVAMFVIFVATTSAIKGVNGIKSFYQSHTSSAVATETVADDTTEQINQLKQQADVLKEQRRTGAITEEEFRARANQLEDQYRTIRNGGSK